MRITIRRLLVRLPPDSPPPSLPASPPSIDDESLKHSHKKVRRRHDRFRAERRRSPQDDDATPPGSPASGAANSAVAALSVADDLGPASQLATELDEEAGSTQLPPNRAHAFNTDPPQRSAPSQHMALESAQCIEEEAKHPKKAAQRSLAAAFDRAALLVHGELDLGLRWREHEYASDLMRQEAVLSTGPLEAHDPQPTAADPLPTASENCDPQAFRLHALSLPKHTWKLLIKQFLMRPLRLKPTSSLEYSWQKLLGHCRKRSALPR